MNALRNAVSFLTLVCILVPGYSSLAQNHAWEKPGGSEHPARLMIRPSKISLPPPAPVNPVYDVIDYRLDLSAAMETEAFGGSNTITLVLKTATDSLILNQHQLTIDSVKVDGDARSAAADDVGETLVVRLGGLRSAGDTVHVVVWYFRDPALQRPTDRLGYFYFTAGVGIPANLGYTMSEPREARCWMPCYDQPWEKSSASINVTVPAGYIAASNGKLLDVVDNGNGTVTWKWREGHQIASYLICATISRWSVSTQPFVRAAGDTIPVQYYTWQADSSVAAAYLPTVRQMLEALSARFGPYPWDKYGTTNVTPFAYGGMEHQSLTTLHRAYMTNDIVVVHELAHQWWGDLVTCGTWPDIWLNESFATYSEAIWAESNGGTPALLQYMAAIRYFSFGSWYGAIYDPEGQGFPLFSSSVYEKGAWVLHTLRGVIGDSAFFGSLARWRQRYGEQSATTADFQSVVEDVTGKPMGWFFSEWIYGAGWPVYSSAYRWGADTLHVTIAQSQDASWPTFRMPLPVRVYATGHDTTVILQDSARLQGFAMPFAVQPDSVVVDPDGWVLKARGATLDVSARTQVPGTFLLAQNYPNPFNPTTVLSWQLPVAGNVRVSVFDLIGREVAVLADGRMEAGRHTATFDGNRLATGMYLYRLRATGVDGVTRTASGKMMLVR